MNRQLAENILGALRLVANAAYEESNKHFKASQCATREFIAQEEMDASEYWQGICDETSTIVHSIEKQFDIE